MKDWSDLEERYQDIRAHDPVAADAFKRWMTARFQETVAALEESGAAEKHQLSAMHQQRVQVRDDGAMTRNIKRVCFANATVCNDRLSLSAGGRQAEERGGHVVLHRRPQRDAAECKFRA